MAVPGVKSDQPFLIPQKRAASIPDSAPIPKKLNNATRTTRERSNNKRDDSSEPKNPKSTENLTEGEVFRHLEAVRTEMATISWYMDLPEKLKIPEILLDFSILNMPEWPDQDTIDKWLVQRHRKPDEVKKKKYDREPQDKKEGKDQEASDEKVKGEPTKNDYENAMQEE
ncbi:uncharacterized protein EURHEDRAFT_375667 [Aspergillus ruber CBS 135680]|uniref:Uncharacterized protein n=1 Tax=Aspergillus ruber (strain CBS 135680) TaxID=1388766 RepID=A0A017SJI8_ASPRC|nr:uncharacterized protein EURHEDRAFT_375667 [Aspergillus ruber CBS 135680]EYE97062.1 hypothetical protein EURHEDRAFT_375667 [Aspergillus ruber CBS 135680]